MNAIVFVAVAITLVSVIINIASVFTPSYEKKMDHRSMSICMVLSAIVLLLMVLVNQTK